MLNYPLDNFADSILIANININDNKIKDLDIIFNIRVYLFISFYKYYINNVNLKKNYINYFIQFIKIKIKINSIQLIIIKIN